MENAVLVTKEKAKENLVRNVLKECEDGELGKLYSGVVRDVCRGGWVQSHRRERDVNWEVMGMFPENMRSSGMKARQKEMEELKRMM